MTESEATEPPEEWPASDPSGQLNDDAWLVYCRLFELFAETHNSEAAGERAKTWWAAYEPEEGTPDLGEAIGIAAKAAAGVAAVSTLRAVAAYITERESQSNAA
jgi:hypothetical protein